MSYDIKTDHTHAIFEITFLDVTKHSVHLKARDELLEMCRVHNIKKILVNAQNLKVDREVSSLNLFNFGVTWVELAARTGIRIAAIPPKDLKTKGSIQFGDNVAYNRGLTVKAFDNIFEAKKWLQDT